MVQVDEFLKKTDSKKDVHLLLQVHDELVYEIKTSRVTELAGEIQKIMQGVLAGQETHGVPILAVAKTGPNWGDLKAV